MRRLLEAFIEEAHEQVQKIVDGIIELESMSEHAEKQKQIETIYRELHNLKGSARGVKFVTIERVCHPIESIVSSIKSQHLAPDVALLDLILTAMREIPHLLVSPPAEALPAALETTYNQLEAIARACVAGFDAESSSMIDSVMILPEPAALMLATQQQATNEGFDAAIKKNDTIKISAARLDQLMQKADELLSVKAMAFQHASEARALQMMIADWAKVWAKAVPEIKSSFKFSSRGGDIDVLKLQKATTKVNSFIDKNYDFMRQTSLEAAALAKTSNLYSHSAATALDLLMDETKQLLMMPCASVFDGLPMLVRDLARQLGKEVSIVIQGGDVELDKRVLNKVRDPIMHIIRNSVDHGIETPVERLRCGKSERGSIVVSVEQLDAKSIAITIVDDGRGIDIEKVKAAALKSGLHSAEELSSMTPERLRALIFKSSLSTSEIITEISGRGIGMAIVEENISQIGGKIKIESTNLKGTKFTISLPVTIATFRALLVEVGPNVFALPTASVERVIRTKRTDLQVISGVDVISIDGAILPICPIESILGLAEAPDGAREFLTICILAAGEKRTGIIVDDVVEEQEVLVKPLGRVLAGIKNVSGLTILGSGAVVPILNASDLLNYKQKYNTTVSSPTVAASSGNLVQKRRILVVDDTLTARLLLCNLLEAAGFVVETAKDGNEALDKLRHSKFALVVTDIEMPNLNGFALTAKIRADSALTDIPVIVVSSLASNEHKEKGVKAGADAYFVKGSLDESNLLDVIRSLI